MPARAPSLDRPSGSKTENPGSCLMSAPPFFLSPPSCRSKIKIRLETAYGEWVERIPAWIKWATQEWNEIQYNGVYWQPPEAAEPGVVDAERSYTFKYPRPPRPRALRIYECHVGMSSQEPKVNSYLEFRDEVLPRIR